MSFVVWRSAHALVVAALGGPWFKFFADGDWYHRILVNGYGDPGAGPAKPTAFFPLLPWLARMVQWVVRSEVAAAVLVTSAATIVALVLVHRLVSSWRDPRTALVTLVLMLAYPASAFLWQFLTEGLFISLAAGALLAQQQRRPVVCGVLAALATMTRVPGIFVVAALIAGELQRSRRLTRSCWWYACGAVGFVPVYVAQRIQTGDGLAFLHAQEAWHRGLSLPWTPIVTAVRTMRDGSTAFGSPLDLAALGGFVALAVLAFRRPGPWSARTLLVATVAVPMFAGLATSMGRYMLAAWPGFAVAAVRRDELTRPVKLALVLLAVLGTLPMLTDWAHGNFVG